MENKYLNRKMIGWLSYNPNYEARDAQYRNNKVCYFYPRYLLQNGSYIPIDNKIDFPQVGRIAVWVQGGDDAESVVDRYGNLVCATLNRSLECNYDSNNYYTARYNYDYGPKSSEIWISTIDSSDFYEVVESFQSVDSIIKNGSIDIPANFSATTKYILLDNHRNIIGPFTYNLTKSKLELQGVASFDFMIGAYNAPQIEKDLLVVRDNLDNEAVPLMPIDNLPPISSCKAKFDLIDNEELLNHFLEQAKIKLDLNRKDFREIKDYITRILSQNDQVEFNEERLNRLQTILPQIFDVNNHILDTLTNIMTSPDVSTVVVQELLKKYPESLKESLASALGVGFKPNAGAAKGVAKNDAKSISADEPADAAQNISSISLPAVALPYDVLNSFFNNEQLKTMLNTLQDTARGLSDKIEKVHEGIQIINSENLSLEDLISSPNFHPEYREVLSKELSALYTCLDSISSFIDKALGRDSDSSAINKSSSATALNELSIKFSRLKDRLTRRQQLLDADVKAEEIDLTLDRLKNDNEIEAVQCTLADVLRNGHLFSEHVTAPFQLEAKRLKKVYESVDNVKNLEQQISDLVQNKESLDATIADLEQQKTQHEEALSKISENFKDMVAPYQDQYKMAAKLLDQSVMQSLQAAVPATIPVMNLAPAQGTPLPVSATAIQPAVTQATQAGATASSNIITNVGVGVITNSSANSTAAAATVVPEVQDSVINVASEDAATAATDGTLLTDNAELLKATFDPECLDNPARYESRKQIIEQLSNFFNKHAGRTITNNELANYLICITQSFITTFAGEPGTGKTSLCNLLAQSLGLVRDDHNNRFVEVSVERGWTSLKDFIGYYNPLTKRMEKSNAEIFDAFYELNKEGLGLNANSKQPNYLSPDKLAPFFILLDEANLSPIEHYWAAFFRNCDDIAKQQRTISLGGKANWFLPENLRFLATINIDHTTEELSARFLDRSWVITLDPQNIDLDTADANDDLLFKDKIVPFASLKKTFSPQSNDEMPKEIANTWQTIQQIFNSNECSLPIRPRNLKMVHNYCLVASSCMNCHGEFGRLAPLDYAIAQKILPTINGNGDRYRILIEKLREVCQPELMPLCAKHLERMQRTGGAELGFYQFFSR